MLHSSTCLRLGGSVGNISILGMKRSSSVFNRVHAVRAGRWDRAGIFRSFIQVIPVGATDRVFTLRKLPRTSVSKRVHAARSGRHVPQFQISDAGWQNRQGV